ncbi:LacI family DNA-binding transcriptional regulator [Salinibacterium sp. NK8237]|uniref:LacI family DNA-binding transcriptional regulator n=1 Tax=Salinibacterium sp. NK8237 TaxID=2792038 RepID=UPI0018CCD6AD|nr:LacI family DNA-binding transcriptional regulator [Salinibacterium sp. NK8237]MBH0130634.1 LacI family DNA-binding transcriptional regulator [Salinibacterium sp. NK8237]
MTTIRDVARHASVAPMTVSRVINQPETVAPETRRRVELSIEALHYVPNLLGQGLRFKRTMVIALVVSDISNPFAIKQILGASNAARDQGFNVIFAHTSASPTEELAQLRSLVERRVDGVVLSPVLNTPDTTDFLQKQGLPVTIMDYPMPENDVDTVRCDSISAARGLTEHLLALGHSRIAMISGPESIVTARERADGYAKAMRASKLEPLVVFSDYSPEGGYRVAHELLSASTRPTGLVTANNFIALGAGRAAIDLGLTIPDDLSIATFDSLSPDSVLDPFFTGVVQPVEAIASRATTMLIERIRGEYTGAGRDVVLPSTLEIHSSTASAPPL